MGCNTLSTHRGIAPPKLDLSLSGQDLLEYIMMFGIPMLVPQFQQIPGTFCNRRGKVEIKLVLLSANCTTRRVSAVGHPKI